MLHASEGSCFLCRLILEDLRKNGKLTGYPLDSTGAGTFPVDGKKKHLALEVMSVDNRSFKRV